MRGGAIRRWKERDACQRTLERLLRDLRVDADNAAASSAGQKP